MWPQHIFTIALVLITFYYARQTQKLVQVANQQRKDLLENEKRRRDEEERRHTAERGNIARGLLAELQDNLKLLEDLEHGADAPMHLDMWSTYKGQIGFLPTDIQEDLRDTAASIQLINAFVAK